MNTLTMPIEQTGATIPTSPQSIKTMSPPSSPPSTATTKDAVGVQSIERRSDTVAVSNSSAASAQLASSSQQKREGPPSSSNNNSSTTLNTTISTTSNNTSPTLAIGNKQQQQQQLVETTKSSSSEVKKKQSKQLTKAQNYVLASKLAHAQQLQQQQQGSRHTRSKSQVGREGQPLQQQKSGQSQPTTSSKPRKQRIITPQMIARRPIETKGTMMRSSHPSNTTKTKSSHSKTSGSGGNSGDSIAESVETDITEQITNNKQSIAKRRREEKMLKKKKYVPTLDKVDTFDNTLDNDDVENDGDVTNTGSIGEGSSNSKGERKFMKSLFAKKKLEQQKKKSDKRFDNAVTAAAKLSKETNNKKKLVSKKSSLVTVADYPLDTTAKKKDTADSTDDTSSSNNGHTEEVEDDINNMESKDSLKTEGSFTLLDTKSPGVQHPSGMTSPVNKKEAVEIVLPEKKSEEKKMAEVSTTTEGRKKDKEEAAQEKKKDIKSSRSPRSSPRSVSSKKSNKTNSSSTKAKKKNNGASTTRATTTTTSNIDAKIEQSNSRVGSLKKELLLLARPGMDDEQKMDKGVVETYSQVEKDSEVDSRWAPGSVASNSSSISSKGSMQVKKKTVEGITPNTAAVSKKKKTKVKKNKRLGNNKKKSFLGKKSKVIKEESEYVSYAEEERDDVEADVNQNEEEDIDDIYERDVPSQPNRRTPASPAITERATTGRQTTTKKKQTNQVEEEEEESAESISMKSTLSDADFFSVESPITTDSEAFNYKPGVFKRTASLVKNPALTLRHRATTTRDGKADEQLMKRMKHGRHIARVDNRKKERAHRLPPPGKIHKKQHQKKEKKDDDTDIKSEEMDQVQQLLAQDDTIEIEKVVVQDSTPEETDKDGMVVVDNEIIEVDDGIAIDDKAHDVACGANSLIEETDVMLEPTGTFEAIEFEEHQYQVRFQASGISVDSSTQRRMNEHLNPTPKAPPSVIRTVSSAGMISAAPSKEMATQTSTDQYVDHLDVNPIVTLTESNVGSTRRNASTANTSEVGSFSHMMESMGLFGAQVCLGSSKFMVNCADSCSDNPKGTKKAAERLVSIDSDVVDRLSPRSAEPRGCGIMVSNKDPEQEAAGIFTRALAIALKSHCQSDGDGGGLDESARSVGVMPKQYHHDEYEEDEDEDQVSLPQQRNHCHVKKKQRHKLDSSNTIYAESIDGRFVPMNQHKRKKRVPRNIAVKPKTKKQPTHRGQEMMQHHEEESEESSAPQDQGNGYEETIELTRTTSSKGKKKGIKGFLNKLSKVRLGLLYEV